MLALSLGLGVIGLDCGIICCGYIFFRLFLCAVIIDDWLLFVSSLLSLDMGLYKLVLNLGGWLVRWFGLSFRLGLNVWVVVLTVLRFMCGMFFVVWWWVYCVILQLSLFWGFGFIMMFESWLLVNLVYLVTDVFGDLNVCYNCWMFVVILVELYVMFVNLISCVFMFVNCIILFTLVVFNSVWSFIFIVFILLLGWVLIDGCLSWVLIYGYLCAWCFVWIYCIVLLVIDSLVWC